MLLRGSHPVGIENFETTSKDFEGLWNLKNKICLRVGKFVGFLRKRMAVLLRSVWMVKEGNFFFLG